MKDGQTTHLKAWLLSNTVVLTPAAKDPDWPAVADKLPIKLMHAIVNINKATS